MQVVIAKLQQEKKTQKTGLYIVISKRVTTIQAQCLQYLGKAPSSKIVINL